MVTWQANDLSTSPPSRQISASEDLRIDIDVTAQLGALEAVDSGVTPVVTCRNLDTDALVATLPAASWQTGDVIRQRIEPGDLERGVTYELIAYWKVATVTDVRATRLILVVVA